MKSLCLLTVALTLSGCATVTPPLTRSTLPPLDTELAQPCGPLSLSTSLDYDEWEKEFRQALAVLAECAIRHRKIVEFYNRTQQRATP